MDWVRPLAMADGIQNGEPPARANKPVGVFVAEKGKPLAAPASAAPQSSRSKLRAHLQRPRSSRSGAEASSSALCPARRARLRDPLPGVFAVANRPNRDSWRASHPLS